MKPTTETRIATALALGLMTLGPALMATHAIAGAVCLALGTGLAAAYNVRTAHDRAASKSEPPPAD